MVAILAVAVIGRAALRHGWARRTGAAASPTGDARTGRQRLRATSARDAGSGDFPRLCSLRAGSVDQMILKSSERAAISTA